MRVSFHVLVLINHTRIHCCGGGGVCVCVVVWGLLTDDVHVGGSVRHGRGEAERDAAA